MQKNRVFSYLLTLLLVINFSVYGQTAIANEKIAKQIEFYKSDIRGTYKNIRWFCKDGTIKEPKDPCGDAIGGIQHATYKDEVLALAKSNQIFLGQILAYTTKEDFWDSQNGHSRLKQYQIGKYLASIDNGWVNQKGQFYRGSIQIEDEQEWGVNFYKWLLAKDQVIERDYYLILQSLKDIPHKGDDNLSQKMRADSKVISDQFTKFMDLRVKIHSNPEFIDIEKTIAFKNSNASKLTPALNKKFDELIVTLKNFHKPVDFTSLNQLVQKLSPSAPLTLKIKEYIKMQLAEKDPAKLCTASSIILLDIRTQLVAQKNPLHRLALLDISNLIENIISKQAALWRPITLEDQLYKIESLSRAAAGTGFIELWEWRKVENILQTTNVKKLKLSELTEKLETVRGVVEWSTAMVKAHYQELVNRYAAFEPLAYSFIDDRIRSSIALQLGKAVGDLGSFIAKESSLTNKVFELENQSTFRGLNPGYAFGQLQVISGNPEDVKVQDDKIYVFERAPADLKPVAGIATVAEGNLVSHVQLLARNLGIPNAALSDENLKDLKKYHGKKVFYAVSNKGNVILKLETSMSKEEKALFAVKVRKEEKIAVPVSEIRLDQKKILNLREVNAEDSGKLCGPKAANLGQLKELFPDKVVEGFVIPFGIFRAHMDQKMPGQEGSYWQFLNKMFKEAEIKRGLRVSENEIEKFQLERLEVLRAAIKVMPLQKSFTDDLGKSFNTILGKEIGKVPVFLRSDTNMEDLKDFTGAGLNLTIFNVMDKNKILQGIKDVWASPYTERSFKWRQKYLLNPENVFPSILVIPSVDVDYSGVMITKGLSSGNEDDLTVAFSQGAGGAVDGQAAESYLIKENGGRMLISPAREPIYNALPLTGGTGKKFATFEKPLLSDQNFNDLNQMAKSIKNTFAKKTKTNYKGAYDIELGFKDNKLWLFQIRPFVENKKALGSDYLESITPKIDTKKEISLSSKL